MQFIFSGVMGAMKPEVGIQIVLFHSSFPFLHSTMHKAQTYFKFIFKDRTVG